MVWFPLFPEERMPVASLTWRARSGFPPHSEVVGITGAPSCFTTSQGFGSMRQGLLEVAEGLRSALPT